MYYLCGMPGSKRVDISVPEEIYAEVCRMVYTQKYEHDPKTAQILKILRERQGSPLKNISYLLERDFEIYRKVAGLKKMAEECGIPYTL